MNDDMLSQDEINELLKGIGNEDDQVDETKEQQASSSSNLIIGDYLTDIEQDALGEIGNISFGSAATALSTLLNQKVEITTPTLSLIESEKLESEFPQPHVAVHVEYTEGFEGMNLLVIKTGDAAIIADLMLGGDGINPASELSDMHVSAVQEAMNQMMGSASTSMSTVFNKRVDISPPGIDLMDLKHNVGTSNVPGDKILVKISFRLKVGELIDSNIMQLVTVTFAKGLVNDLMNPMDEELSVDESFPEIEMPQAPSTQAETRHMESPQEERMTQSSYPEPTQASSHSREQQHIGSGVHSVNGRQSDVQPAAFSNFEPAPLSNHESNNLNMLLDIPLQVTVELGRTKRSIKEILELGQGSIIELDKLAGEPVDILVNQKLIAKGEVVVIEENFGVRVTDIVSQEDRIRNLK
ncbi:flagellar motor switch phosphatase FliY [Alkalihalophilus lindianensis]|uniref:Flagellar motor switch phosphatase FliY n=1 Tax=Alkalihalophilus lindianensis TaxID=1630542 RepID=A0ABU3XDC3_9BACI|nr:flagellar motor switch phosphatase FliY [Alkalihalophilus lindianensis]MDV2685439.1 flagellar motor switch phosphatase FliY [Alkalihalophilus lindianensis]